MDNGEARWWQRGIYRKSSSILLVTYNNKHILYTVTGIPMLSRLFQKKVNTNNGDGVAGFTLVMV